MILATGRPESKERKMFFEFISGYLGVEVLGVQAGAGRVPDQLLFNAEHGSTLAVPVTTLLLTQAEARTIVSEKIAASLRSFSQHGAND